MVVSFNLPSSMIQEPVIRGVKVLTGMLLDAVLMDRPLEQDNDVCHFIRQSKK